MKSPILLFSIKCAVILYFAACTGINDYTKGKSATPHVTKGAWKVNLFVEAENDNTTTFDGYTLTFETTGKIIADKNGKKITGNWAEDDISNRITIHLNTEDPALSKLNNYWSVSSISPAGLSFLNADNPSTGRLEITGL